MHITLLHKLLNEMQKHGGKKRRKAHDNTKNGITCLNYLIITTSRYFDKQGFKKSYEAHRITEWLVFWCSNTMFFTPYYLSQVCYESNCWKKGKTANRQSSETYKDKRRLTALRLIKNKRQNRTNKTAKHNIQWHVGQE